MNYAKPEIALLASASSAIQGTTLPKERTTTSDGMVVDYVTPSAYEADE